MQQNDSGNNENNQNRVGINDPDFAMKREVQKRKCPNCKETVERKEMCSSCNHYMGETGGARYQPISRKTRWIIKLVLALVFTTVAVILLWDRIISCMN